MHAIERFIGNQQSKPWWLGLPEVEGLYELTNEDYKLDKLRRDLFNYEVKLVPCEVLVDGNHKRVPDQFSPVCSDGYVIPATVGKKYEIFQPRHMVELLAALSHKENDCRVHTAGILDSRRLMWALCELEGQFRVDSDMVRKFMLASTSFDGSSKTLGKPTDVTVVCWNTHSAAIQDGVKPIVAERHTGDSEEKLERARVLLEEVRDQFEEHITFCQGLAELQFTRDQFRVLTYQLLSGKDDEDEAVKEIVDAEGRRQTLFNAKGGELMRCYDSGMGAGQRQRTGWKALQAVTEFIDWQRGRMANYNRMTSRLTVQGLQSSWFGEGDRVKRRAAGLIQKAA